MYNPGNNIMSIRNDQYFSSTNPLEKISSESITNVMELVPSTRPRWGFIRRAFESTYMGNRFVTLMYPAAWGYELMEAWFPNSAWNPGNKIAMVNDYEGLKGRKSYARIGGCYYTGRNMVGEYLNNERRQARVVILRETYPGQQMPMGVWLVREMVRKALEFPYKKYDTLQEAFEYIKTRLLIKPEEWIISSGLLSHAPETRQKSLYSFLKN